MRTRGLPNATLLAIAFDVVTATARLPTVVSSL
jgi:hypothetical protein